jgi:amino acid transporter
MKKVLIHTLYSILAAIPITALLFLFVDISISWIDLADMAIFTAIALPVIIAGQYMIIRLEERWHRTDQENGNVIFIILLGIALFAALTYVVSGSMRGSPTMDKENARLAATAILQDANLLTNALSLLTNLQGCSESEISFARAPFSASDTDYDNPNAPGDYSCHMFHHSGAGGHHGEGWSYAANFSLAEVASIAPELTAIYDVGSDERLCGTLNEMLLKDSTVPSAAQPAATLFKGTFPSPGANLACGGLTTVCSRFCQKDTTSGTFKFYHALIAR